MKGKRAEMATSTLIIFIALLIMISIFLYLYLSQIDTLVSDSYSNVKLSESSLTKGFDLLQVKASDGRTGTFNEFFIVARLLPDSDEIAFNQMNIVVQFHNWTAGLVYRNDTIVQNDTGYVGYANGTGFFQAEHLIESQFHQPGHIVRGETVKFYVHIPGGPIYDETIGFNIVAANGISFPVTVHTGDTISADEFILLYPRI